MIANISQIIQNFTASKLVEIRIFDPIQHVMNAI